MQPKLLKYATSRRKINTYLYKYFTIIHNKIAAEMRDKAINTATTQCTLYMRLGAWNNKAIIMGFMLRVCSVITHLSINYG